MNGNNPPNRNFGKGPPGLPDFGMPPGEIPPEDLADGYIIMPEFHEAVELKCPDCGGIDWSLLQTLPKLKVKMENKTTGKVQAFAQGPPAMGAICMTCGKVLAPQKFNDRILELEAQAKEQEGEGDGE